MLCATLTLLCIQAFRPTVSAVSAGADRTTSASESNDFSRLTHDELIAQLPIVEVGEGHWDKAARTFIDDPFVAEMRARLNRGVVFSDAQWQTALTRTSVFRVRDRWPAGEPFAVSIVMPRWLGVAELRAIPKDRRLGVAKGGMLMNGGCGTYNGWVRDAARYQRLGELPLGEHALDFEVTVERGRDFFLGRASDPAPGILWNGMISFHTTIVDGIDRAVPPVESDELAGGVRAAIGAGVREWWIDEKWQNVVYLAIDPDVDAYPMIRSTSLSLQIDVLRNGALVEQVHVLPARIDRLLASNSIHKSNYRIYASAHLDSVPIDVFDDGAKLAGWALRVRGTSKHVLAQWEVTGRWSGEFTMSLAEALATEKERTGPNGRRGELSTPRW